MLVVEHRSCDHVLGLYVVILEMWSGVKFREIFWIIVKSSLRFFPICMQRRCKILIQLLEVFGQ